MPRTPHRRPGSRSGRLRHFAAAGLTTGMLAALVVPASQHAYAAESTPARPARGVEISDGGIRSSQPVVTAVGTTLVTAWSDGAVKVRRSADSGTTQLGIKQLGAGTDPSIAASGSVVAVAWSNPSYEVMLAVSTDGGANFAVNNVGDRLAQPGLQAFTPQVAVGNNQVHVAFGSTAGGWSQQAPVHVATATLGGAWNLKKVGSSSRQGRGLAVAAAAASAVVAFDDGNAGVTLVGTSDGGSNWQSRRRVELPGVGSALDVHAVYDGLQAWVAYSHHTVGESHFGNVMLMPSTDAGVTFADPIAVNGAQPALASDFALATSGGSAHLAYSVAGHVVEAHVNASNAVSARSVANMQGKSHSISVSDGVDAVGWYSWGGDAGRTEAFVAASYPGRGSVVRNVSESAGHSYQPAVHAFDESWTLVWTDLEMPAGGGYGSSAVYLATGTPLDPDLRIESVTPVQASAAATTIVAGKLTALRAKLRVTLPDTFGVAIRWHAEWTDEHGAAKSYEAREFRQISPGSNTLHHEIPGGLRPGEGAVKVTATVDPDNAYAEPDETNNTSSREVRVILRGSYKVLVRTISVPGEVAVPCAAIDRAAAGIERGLKGAFPIDDRNVRVDRLCDGPDIDFGGATATTGSDFFTRLLFSSLVETGYDNVVAVVPDGFMGRRITDARSALGLAWPGEKPVVVVAGAAAGYVSLHELAHSLGWVSPDSVVHDDNNDWHTDMLPAQGYHVAEHTTKATVDFMHWQADTTPDTLSRWISRETWDHLLAKFPPEGEYPVPGLAAAAAADRLVSVSGSLTAAGKLTLAPVGPAEASVPPIETGESVRVRLLDGTGTAVADTKASLVPTNDSDHGVSDLVFRATLPDVTTTVTAEVSRNGAVLGTATRSAHDPAVELTDALGGIRAVGDTLHVRWTATDADRDELRSYISISADGGTSWRSVASLEPGAEQAADITLTRHLAGDDVRVRVTVSDGWRQSTAESAPMEVGGGVRNGAILMPVHEGFGDFDLYTVRPDGTQLKEVIGGIYNVNAARMSPDGKTIAFSASASGVGSGLFLADADGTNVRMRYRFFDRTKPIQSTTSFDWSPDSKQLVVSAGMAYDVPAGLWLLDVAAGEPRRIITLNDTSGDARVRWSPDGSRIGFGDGAPDQSDSEDIFTARADGTDRRAAFATPRLVSLEGALSWSPDSTHLVFERFISAEHANSLWTVPVASGTATRVGNSAEAFDPIWSPDGDELLVKRIASGAYRLFRLPISGGAPVAVGNSPVLTSHHGSWSGESVMPAPDPATQPPTVSAGGPYTADERSTVLARASVTGGAQPVAVTWDVDGDGEYDDGTGVEVSFTTRVPGKSAVVVRAEGADGQVSTGIATVDVRNLPPVITDAAAGRDGSAATLTARVSDAASVTVDWGDGNGPVAVPLADGQFVVTGPSVDGPVVIVATDASGATARASVAVPLAPNAAPTAVGQDVTTVREMPLRIAGLAADADRDELTYRIAQPPAHGNVTFVVDAGSTAPVVLYSPEAGFTGNDTFAVVATDGRAESAAATVTVQVTPRDSDSTTVAAGADVSVVEGSPISLTGTATNLFGATLQWRFTPGNGVDAGATCVAANVTAAATTVTCTDDGTWTATLEAVRSGSVVASDAATVTVTNAAPVVAVTAPADGLIVRPGQAVTIAGTASDAGANDTVTASIDTGDGTAAKPGTQATHAFTRAGVYVVTVTAKDDDGATGSAAAVVVVQDATVTKGFVAGGGKVDGGAPVGFAAYTGKSVRGALVIAGPAAGTRVIGIVDKLTLTSTTAQLSGSALFGGRTGFRFQAAVVDGAPDTVSVTVTSTATGAVVWSTGGVRPLRPGAAVVRAA